MANPGNAAPQQDMNETVEEPSMDDIMASIRQIIAEDEQASGDSVSERDRYTHPTNPSNVNDPVSSSQSEPDLMAAMQREMETVVKEEVASQMEAPVADAPPIPMKPALGAAAAVAAASIQNRVHATPPQPPLSAVDDKGLTLEQRLEKYRTTAMRSEELRKKNEAEREALRKSVLGAQERVEKAIPSAVDTSVTPQAVAEALMNASGATISSDLTEIMRPVVRQWLSDNLSGIVERLVREEIERVSRGRKLG
ncbi:PopZ family protein [Pseudahrensia aquimaris]|uniref:PopZ family protein n=1 Tax=Pseudahrensia aquimaris TaxID=744461 RepID=A0ABW3FJN8_9HYPH